jgi:Uma2 family endonuclease
LWSKTAIPGAGPNFVMEMTSKKTRLEDQRPKMRLYAELQVPEYSSSIRSGNG